MPSTTMSSLQRGVSQAGGVPSGADGAPGPCAGPYAGFGLRHRLPDAGAVQAGRGHYGIDGSVEMLSEARTKCAEAGADILFLCQNMLSIDLYGTVDTALCTLDSLNHLKNGEELQRVFEKVSFFMNPGGYFLFDMNTLYKHQVVLGNETYVYDMDHVYCVWQNRCHAGGKVDIQLDFFEPEGGLYARSTERFSERAYPVEEVLERLSKAGFGEVQVFDELTFNPPREDSQRLVFAAKKRER